MKYWKHLYLRCNLADPNLIIQDLQQIENQHTLDEVVSIYCVLEYVDPITDNTGFIQTSTESRKKHAFEKLYNSRINGMVFQYLQNMIVKNMPHLQEMSFECVQSSGREIKIFEDIKISIVERQDIHYKIRFCLPTFNTDSEKYIKDVISVCFENSTKHIVRFSMGCHVSNISYIPWHKFVNDITHINIEYSQHASLEFIKKEWEKAYSIFKRYKLMPYQLWHFALNKHESMYLEAVYALENYLGIMCGYRSSSKKYAMSFHHQKIDNKDEWQFQSGVHKAGHVANNNGDIVWNTLSNEQAFALYVRQASCTRMGLVLLPCFNTERYLKILKEYNFVCVQTANTVLRYVRDIHLWYNTIH